MLLPYKNKETFEKTFTLLKLEGRIKINFEVTFLIDFKKTKMIHLYIL